MAWRGGRMLFIPSTDGSTRGVRLDGGNGHNTEAPDSLRGNGRAVPVGEGLQVARMAGRSSYRLAEGCGGGGRFIARWG